MRKNPYQNLDQFHVRDAFQIKAPLEIDCDVVIIGSGAGGGVAARELAGKGKRVVMLEAGPLKSSNDFHMKEAPAYRDLYQDCAARKTKDKAISILQGRCVGGSTTVNWTTSFRTPQATRKYWAQKYGMEFCLSESFEKLFDEVESYFGISSWEVPPNGNNDLLEVGLKKLGLSSGRMKRNVRDCHNLGYCGMGCPVNAKQGTLLTSIPDALKNQMQLFYNCQASFLSHDGQRVKYVVATRRGEREKILKINTSYVISCAGAIGTPALLIKSGLRDQYETLGKRTFLHPVTISAGIYDQEVEPYYGAPQSVYSDQFLYDRPIDGSSGFKLEVPPVHPLILASALPVFGDDHLKIMKSLPHLHALLALQRDGFHPESSGGQVSVDRSGNPHLDYPLTSFLQEGFRESLLQMAKIQFASGARWVVPLHSKATPMKSFSHAKSVLNRLSMEALQLKVLSAHVMGGAGMGVDPKTSVVNLDGRYHGMENLYIFDGSIFPTSVGANPMESIYTFSLWLTRNLLKLLG